MAGKSNQKLKLLYIMQLLLDQSDENHGMTMPELISALRAYGVSAERKSVYSDIEALRLYGLDIIGEQREKTYEYYVGSRQFELAELKLLVDSVQSAKFITAKKSNELIKKLEGLASKHEAKQLQRQVYVSGRIKTMNESIYYNIDKIHSAISDDVKIKFQYFKWNVNKKMELRKDGVFYTVSPWVLLWDNENYYMVGFDSEAGIMKHYRVDKMLQIGFLHSRREGKELFGETDMAHYAKQRFSMFDGEEQSVKLEVRNQLAGVIIDRFGKDVSLIKKDENHFTVNVDVAVSRQFFAWVISLGEEVKIVAPKSVIEQMKSEINRLAGQYLNEK